MAGFGGVTQKNNDFSRSVVAGIDLHKLLPVEIDVAESFVEKVPDRMGLAGRDNVIVRLFLLEHQPDRFHIIGGVAPIAFRIQITEEELFLKSQLDSGYGFRS